MDTFYKRLKRKHAYFKARKKLGSSLLKEIKSHHPTCIEYLEAGMDDGTSHVRLSGDKRKHPVDISYNQNKLMRQVIITITAHDKKVLPEPVYLSCDFGDNTYTLINKMVSRAWDTIVISYSGGACV